jgi:hypothetical protein
MPNLLVLFESASGYSLLEAVEGGDLAALKTEVQGAVTDLARFSKIVKLHAFQPFSTAENALANINDISEGIVNDDLRVRRRGERERARTDRAPPTRPVFICLTPALLTFYSADFFAR